MSPSSADGERFAANRPAGAAVISHPDIQTAIKALVDSWVSNLGLTSLALTGGRAGTALAETLVDAWPIGRTLAVWFSDERYLPLGDPARNDTVLLDHLKLRGRTDIEVHSARGPEKSGDIERSAAEYAEELQRCGYPQSAVLSIGPDGHIASLFPGHELLERPDASVAAISNSPKPPPCRVTWTLPLILAIPKVSLVAFGPDKYEAVSRMLAGDISLPATRVWYAGAQLHLAETGLENVEN